MLSSGELRENREEIKVEICKLRDTVLGKDGQEGREFTSEEQGKWDKLNGEYDSLTRQIDIATRAETLEATSSAPLPMGVPVDDDPGTVRNRDGSPNAEDRSLAFQGWARYQSGIDLEDRHTEALERCSVNPRNREFRFELHSRPARTLDEFRAQSVGTTTAGGFLVPEGFVNNFEHALLQFGGVRQVAQVMRTTTGNDLPWPTVNDTGNAGALIAENAAVTEQDITIGQLLLKAYKYTSKLVRVSTELMQDSAFNMATELGSLLGERIGRIANTHQTTGTGSGQPNGIVTASTLGKTTATGSAIAPDELFDLVHAVDPAYRANATFMMHDNILLAIRKLKDSNNQYLWVPGIGGAAPDRLLGYSVVTNQDMASSVGVNNITVLFGDMSKYKIREVADIRFRRADELYLANDQVGFVAFMRMDANLLDAGTNPVQHLKQAAI